mgnify:CR=1 FL=1
MVLEGAVEWPETVAQIEVIVESLPHEKIVDIQRTIGSDIMMLLDVCPPGDADKKTWTTIFITFLAATYIFYDSIQLGNFFGDIFGFITALGLAVGAVIIRSAKDRNLVPSAAIGKLLVAIFALFFVESFELVKTDIYIVPLMCIMCVAIPFVLVTIAPRFITAAEVNLFFLLETILGPIWVWLVIKEQPSLETIQGGLVIVISLAIHSYLSLKKNTN